MKSPESDDKTKESSQTRTEKNKKPWQTPVLRQFDVSEDVEGVGLPGKDTLNTVGS